MKMDRELDSILAEIGREHRATAAPESVEAALAAAADRRAKTGLPRLRPAWAWGFALVLLAAIAWSGILWQMRRSHGPRDREPLLTRSVQTPPAKRDSPPSLRSEASRDAQAVSALLRRVSMGGGRLHTASHRRAAENSLQEFVPLPISEGLPPAAQLSVVRVHLVGNDLQQYGLEAPADAAVRTLLAEFVVGEDGLPRAIRIVQ